MRILVVRVFIGRGTLKTDTIILGRSLPWMLILRSILSSLWMWAWLRWRRVVRRILVTLRRISRGRRAIIVLRRLRTRRRT